MQNIIWALITLVGIGGGTGLGYILRKKMAQNQANSIEAKAEKLLAEAKTQQQELVLQGKEKAAQLLDEVKKEEKQIKQDLHNAQERLERRETMFDQKLIELESSKQKLQEQANKIQQVKTDIEKLKDQELEKLQNIASLTKDEAKEELLKRIEEQSKGDLTARVLKLEKESNEVYEEKARELIADAVQRCASSHAAEITSTTVHLTSEDMKGRIIGKEGRNIKTIEKLTGCELIIDDTPDAIVVSGFSPIRRQIAKLALEKLMADGRIPPVQLVFVV
jgi:ribonuclease Y